MGDTTTYIGIDLGGARGRTTAVATMETSAQRPETAAVLQVSTRDGDQPWTDTVLVNHITNAIKEPGSSVVVAVNAPLTVPACVRCTLSECPGEVQCVDPATLWLRTEGREIARAGLADLGAVDLVVAGATSKTKPSGSSPRARQPHLAPYVHRCTEVVLHYGRHRLPRGAMGNSNGPIAARAAHLRRRLASHGFELNRNLLEVSPRATVAAMFDRRRARGYKRDADPWATRAEIVEALDDLHFAARSRLSREEVLRNDHCFEALLSAYSAFRAQRDRWDGPLDGLEDDGWIWAP